MNEHETHPERLPAGSDAEPSRANSQPFGLPTDERGQFGSPDETTRNVTPTSGAQPGAHSHAATAPVPPGGTSGPGQPEYARYPNPWGPGGDAQASQPAASPQPAMPQQSQWAAPSGGYPHTGGQPHQQPGYAYAPSGQQYGATPYQQTPYQGQQIPSWATSVGEPPPRRDRKIGRFFIAGAAAIVLALGAGGVGAWTALALDDDTTTFTTTGEPVNSGDPAPVIDRSSLASIAASVQDSVVSIATEATEGSGVVLSADGFILSNNHVVASATGPTVNVIFADGATAKAKVIGTDARTDLAVIKADGVSDLTPAKLGNSAAMKVGDTVLALGSPLGLQGSVTAGIISAKDRTIQVGAEDQGQQDPFAPQQNQAGHSISGLLQTDAPINPGNSGGALVNTNGEVIGINTAIATSGSGNGSIGVGFAIPSNKAKEVSEALKAGQKVSHPFLGVSVSEAGGGGGALVATVTANSPAAKAGLQRGDVITKLNGKPVNGSDDVIAAVQTSKVGAPIAITYTRNGAEKSVNAVLAESP